MSKISIKFVSTILSMTLITSVFCCCPVQAAAAEEVTAPQTNTNFVYPVTVRIDQQAGIAIAQKRAEEEAQIAAEQAAAQEAARQAAEAEKAAQEKASKQKAKTTSSKTTTPKYSKGSTTGQTIVNVAKSLIGTPYGAKVGGITIDCSGLVCYAYQQVGISLPHSSSQQAKYCNDNGYAISKSELQPGDLIFWSYSWGSGFMNIGHVGIYAGNGQVIDASPNGVVQRNLYDQSCICFYGRPY